MPAARPLRDAVLTAFAVTGVGAMAVVQLAGGGALEQLTRALLVVVYGVLAGHVAILGGRVLAGARPRL